MDLVFNVNGSATYLDLSIVASFSCNPALVAAASTRAGHMAKRAEKSIFDRYPHIYFVPFILRPPAALDITPENSSATSRKTLTISHWPSGTPGQPSRAYSTAPSPNNTLQPPLRDPRAAFCHTLSCFSLSPWSCEVSVPSLREHLQWFQFQTRSSRVMWACCDDTSSDDDEHNTDNSLLLLFADAYILVSPRLMTSS